MFLAIALTSGIEYCFVPKMLLKPKKLEIYKIQKPEPTIEYQHKTLRLNPKTAKYIFRQHKLLWCEKALKQAGCTKISNGDLLAITLKKENNKTQVIEAHCYTQDDSQYILNLDQKTIIRKKLKRVHRKISEEFKKSFLHSIAKHNLPKSMTVESLKALGTVINTKTLKSGMKIQMVYSTALLPNGVPFNSKLRYVGIKDKVDVFLFLNNGTTSYYDKEGKLLVKDTLKMPVRSRMRLGDGFGYRCDPFTRKRKFHFGLDICAPTGTPVYASAAGTVVYCGYQSGFGNIVEVRHTPTMRTRYAHLNKIAVKRGQNISHTTIVGTIGMTGRTTGPHLHYEVLKNGQQVNPRKFSVLDSPALSGKILAAFKAFRNQCLSL